MYYHNSYAFSSSGSTLSSAEVAWFVFVVGCLLLVYQLAIWKDGYVGDWNKYYLSFLSCHQAVECEHTNICNFSAIRAQHVFVNIMLRNPLHLVFHLFIDSIPYCRVQKIIYHWDWSSEILMIARDRRGMTVLPPELREVTEGTQRDIRSWAMAHWLYAQTVWIILQLVLKLKIWGIVTLYQKINLCHLVMVQRKQYVDFVGPLESQR